jgi:hypothetical protein
MQTADEILATLDAACESYAFPMLDNGYVYLAATRLALFRSSAEWAIVVEVFGFSPRTGLPDLAVSTFGSTLHDRNPPANYVSDDAYRNYLRKHPHDERRYFSPIRRRAVDRRRDGRGGCWTRVARSSWRVARAVSR